MTKYVPIVLRKEIAERCECRIPYLDFYVVFMNTETHTLLNSMEDLYSDGIEVELPTMEVTPMIDLLKSIIGEDFGDCSEDDSPIPMFVVTTPNRMFGGIFLSMPSILKQVARKINKSEFYVLPSSVHEFIVLPANASCEVGELKTMVQDINADQVPYDEVLSDNVYIYSMETNKLSII